MKFQEEIRIACRIVIPSKMLFDHPYQYIWAKQAIHPIQHKEIADNEYILSIQLAQHCMDESKTEHTSRRQAIPVIEFSSEQIFEVTIYTIAIH